MGRLLPKTPSRFLRALNKEPKMTHLAWAEKYLQFTGSNVSPFPGKFKSSRSAHLRKVFEIYDMPQARTVALMWASQTAKTLAITIPAAKKLDTDPSYIHWIYPVKDKVGDLIRIKLDPVLKSIKKVWRKLEDFKTEEKIREKRTIKEIGGGGLYITGTTANDLKSISVPLTIGDEIGEMDKGTMAEATERQKAYSRVFPRTIGASTIVHPDDEIVNLYNSCECKLQYQFICPECSGMFPDNIQSIDEDVKTVFIMSRAEYAKELEIDETSIEDQRYLRYATDNAHVKCPHCLHKIYDAERERLLYNGKSADWKVISGDFETAKSFGFKMGSLTAWVVTMESAVKAVLDAGDDPEKLDILYRNWFNQFYTPDTEKTSDAHSLIEICNTYDIGKIPDDTVALYLGVDTQKDHFWGSVVAYRKDKNPHIVMARKIDTFKEILDMFDDNYYYEDGKLFDGGIKRLAIDMRGYVEVESQFNEERGIEEKVITVNRPQEVQEFCYEWGDYYGQIEERERIYACVGVEKLANDIPFLLGDTKVEVGLRKEKRTMRFAKLNSISLKLSVMAAMNRGVLLARGEEVQSDHKNIMSIASGFEDSFGGENDKLHLFHQLTSEVYGYNVTTKKKYKTFRRVKKDNHYLDCVALTEFLATMDRVETMDVPSKEEVLSAKDLFA